MSGGHGRRPDTGVKAGCTGLAGLAPRHATDGVVTLSQQAVSRSRDQLSRALVEKGSVNRRSAACRTAGYPTARWIVLHIIEEYARHNSHADLIREVVDSPVGE